MKNQLINKQLINNQMMSNIEVVNQSKLNFYENCCILGVRAGLAAKARINTFVRDERGDVPGWVLIVLMTTGLVTGIWAIAKPNLTNILQNSLNSMNGIR